MEELERLSSFPVRKGTLGSSLPFVHFSNFQSHIKMKTLSGNQTIKRHFFPFVWLILVKPLPLFKSHLNRFFRQMVNTQGKSPPLAFPHTGVQQKRTVGETWQDELASHPGRITLLLGSCDKTLKYLHSTTATCMRDQSGV